LTRFWKFFDLQQAHSDIGLISVAPRSTTPGLQLREFDTPYDWVNVENKMGPNDVIVFAGQALTRMTSGVYRPVLHRPVIPLQGDRMSFVFFLRAKAKSIVDETRKARAAGSFFVPAEAKVALVIRIRGINCLSPTVRKILQLFRLR